MTPKETLEEAAERLYPEEWDWKEREIFIEGAKWQQETSSQIEISDEEIEKAARDYDNSVIYGPPLVHFEQGAFWYREQLKNETKV